MYKILKRIFCLLLVGALLIQNTNVQASEEKKPKKIKIEDILKKSNVSTLRNSKGTSIETYEVTNKEDIKQIAKEQSLNNPDKIKSITYTYTIDENTSEDILISPFLTSTTVILDVVDLGTGYSFWDDYESDIFYCPAEINLTYSRKSSSGFKCDLGITASSVTAAVGFNASTEFTRTSTYKKNVTEYKKLEVRVLTNYQMKSFKAYTSYSNAPGLLYNETPGKAWKPVGLIFQSILYDR